MELGDKGWRDVDSNEECCNNSSVAPYRKRELLSRQSVSNCPVNMADSIGLFYSFQQFLGTKSTIFSSIFFYTMN